MSYPRLDIEYPDGRTENVQVRPRDVMAFEKHFQIPYASAWVDASMAFDRVQGILADRDIEDLDDEGRTQAVQGIKEIDAAINASHLFFLAWHAATKGKGLEFDEWLDTIDDVSYAPGSAVEAVPLEKGGSTPTSSNTQPSLSTPESPSPSS